MIAYYNSNFFKTFLSFGFILGLFGSVCAYSPTESDLLVVQKIGIQISDLAQIKPTSYIQSIYKKAKILQPSLETKLSERDLYIYAEFINSLAKYGNISFDNKTQLVEKYGENMLGKPINVLCMNNYEFIDKIAAEYDFPTEIILAIWQIEHNCLLSNPANGYGAFQIMSQNYPAGEFSQDEFKPQVVNFIKFCRNKQNRYESRKNKDKTVARFNKITLKLNHNDFDEASIKALGILYNGLKSTNLPDTSLYVNGNLTPKFKYKKDGLLTLIIKIMKEKR